MKIKILLAPGLIVVIVVAIIWYVYPAYDGVDGVRERGAKMAGREDGFLPALPGWKPDQFG